MKFAIGGHNLSGLDGASTLIQSLSVFFLNLAVDLSIFSNVEEAFLKMSVVNRIFFSGGFLVELFAVCGNASELMGLFPFTPFEF